MNIIQFDTTKEKIEIKCMKDSDWREINEYFAQIFSKKGIYMCVKREVAAMIKECNHIKTLPMLYVEFLYALSKDEK